MQQVTSAPLPNVIKCPTSKSYGNRALLIGALSQEEVVLRDLPEANDVTDLITNLRCAGLKITGDLDELRILNSFPLCEQANEEVVALPGSEGGTTIRFLLTLLALGKNKYQVLLKGRMSERPLQNQMALLSSLGATVALKGDKIEIQGPIEFTDSISVDASDTTQFASTLLILRKFFEFDLEIKNVKFSNAYLNLTRKICKTFNTPYIVPADFSSISYPSAYAFLNVGILFENVFEIDRDQADAKLFELFENWEVSHRGLKIHPINKSIGLEVDVSDCLDLFPTLAYMASFLEDESCFTNLKFLKDKETNRLEEVLKVFDSLGQSYSYDESADILRVTAGVKLQFPRNLDLPNDHRIVMMAALFAKQLGGGKIQQYQAVSKSYPGFFNLFR